MVLTRVVGRGLKLVAERIDGLADTLLLIDYMWGDVKEESDGHSAG